MLIAGCHGKWDQTSPEVTDLQEYGFAKNCARSPREIFDSWHLNQMLMLVVCHGSRKMHYIVCMDLGPWKLEQNDGRESSCFSCGVF
jgi:hypothetical protein